MSSLEDLEGILCLSSKKSLKLIKNVLPLLRGRARFPIRITCPYCEHALIIRGLDDFPLKSVICNCKKIYLVKLIEVPDGSPEKDQTPKDGC